MRGRRRQGETWRGHRQAGSIYQIFKSLWHNKSKDSWMFLMRDMEKNHSNSSFQTSSSCWTRTARSCSSRKTTSTQTGRPRRLVSPDDRAPRTRKPSIQNWRSNDQSTARCYNLEVLEWSYLGMLQIIPSSHLGVAAASCQPVSVGGERGVPHFAGVVIHNLHGVSTCRMGMGILYNRICYNNFLGNWYNGIWYNQKGKMI